MCSDGFKQYLPCGAYSESLKFCRPSNNIFLLRLSFDELTNFDIVRVTLAFAVPDYRMHKVYVYKEYHSVCSLDGIGTPPPLLLQASVPPPLPPGPKGWAHSPAGGGGGWGSPSSEDWKKSLALCLLCDRMEWD
jgi:hypothetical protein